MNPLSENPGSTPAVMGIFLMYSKTWLYCHHREKGILVGIDQGLEFCQLHVDIVRHACAIDEKKVSTLY